MESLCNVLPFGLGGQCGQLGKAVARRKCGLATCWLRRGGGQRLSCGTQSSTPCLLQVNAELLEALKLEMSEKWKCNSYHPKLIAAIAKAEGEIK